MNESRERGGETKTSMEDGSVGLSASKRSDGVSVTEG